jgi:HEAT repeat protein
VDQRLLHAILDFPENSLPDIVRFAAQDHDDDLMDLEPLLIDLFHTLHTPAAVPFLVRAIRNNMDDVPDDLVEAIVELGASAVEPLLALLGEFEGKDAGDIPFVLAAVRVRDARVLEALTRRLAVDPQDAALVLETYGDPAAIPAMEAALAQIPAGDSGPRAPLEAAIRSLRTPDEPDSTADEPFDIWDLYPQVAAPDFHALEDEDRLAMLQHGSPTLRAEVASSCQGTELPDAIRARLVQLAKTDPEPKVRGACWEALGEIGDDPELREAMLKVLADPKAPIEERAGAAIGLAEQSDNPAVYKAIQNLYEDPRSRAKALKAMARSFDKRFSAYPSKHLDDPDPATKTQAIWGVGYLNLASEAPRLAEFFDQDEFRTDALFAYALAIPGETSAGRIRALMAKVEKAAGGFREDEEDLVRIALDQRLMLHGKDPVFFPDEEEEDEHDHDHLHAPEPVIATPKPGRNDLCSCGSGKKYKKCHGLVN